jgi:hypothetical protein
MFLDSNIKPSMLKSTPLLREGNDVKEIKRDG